MIPIGTLIRKIQCQLAYCTRMPPSGGPIAAAAFATTASSASPRPRWCGGKVIAGGAGASGARSLGRLGLGASGRGRRGLLADRGRRAVELAQDLAVALVGEPLPRLAGGEPLEPVDLLIGQETAPERGHQPVAHQLPAAVAV